MKDFVSSENWSELSTLTGNAEHVPAALSGLLSYDRSEFEASYWKIDNHVVVQSDLYSAAAVVPKYLEEIFPLATYKNDVLELLYEIGNGSSESKALEDTCYREVIAVLDRLQNSEELELEMKIKIKEYLAELKAIRKDRDNCT